MISVLDAPFAGDAAPAAPPGTAVPGLWNHEGPSRRCRAAAGTPDARAHSHARQATVVEVFLLGEREEYVEIELGPYAGAASARLRFALS